MSLIDTFKHDILGTINNVFVYRFCENYHFKSNELHGLEEIKKGDICIGGGSGEHSMFYFPFSYVMMMWYDYFPTQMDKDYKDDFKHPICGWTFEEIVNMSIFLKKHGYTTKDKVEWFLAEHLGMFLKNDVPFVDVPYDIKNTPRKNCGYTVDGRIFKRIPEEMIHFENTFNTYKVNVVTRQEKIQKLLKSR